MQSQLSMSQTFPYYTDKDCMTVYNLGVRTTAMVRRFDGNLTLMKLLNTGLESVKECQMVACQLK